MEELKLKKYFKRFFPIIVLVSFSIISYYLGLKNYLSFEVFRENREHLMHYVNTHKILAPTVFMLIYITSVALSLPVATFLTVLGGFLFPQPFSTIYVVVSASIGATIFFLAAKTAFGNLWREKAETRMDRIRKGFEKNGWSYLLFLRLVPLFPFWLVNLASAILSVKLWQFFWTTFVGIAPASFFYAQAGAGLSEILETVGPISISNIFNWKLRVALLGMGFFALLPAIIKLFIQRKNDAGQ